MSLLTTLKAECHKSLMQLYPNEIALLSENIVEITPATQKKFGHYQCNSAMKLTKVLGKPPRKIAEEIRDKLLLNQEVFESIEIAGPGFINITIKTEYLDNLINTQLLDKKCGCAYEGEKQRVVIDFSSPNIAKEMHVGHLRSTIIGDSIARTLEFVGHSVVRLNHVGDWGTQFGMLIAYLKSDANSDIDKIKSMDLSQLVSAYKNSKQIFDENPEFKKQSQTEVVSLQAGNPESIQIWNIICQISRQAFEKIYSILDIKLKERGESFYNPMLADVIKDLEDKKLITISDGAKCIYLDGYINREGSPLPLMVQKSDGGFNYATTDIAALRHRVDEEKATWLIYVTDAGQAQHFNMVFDACKKAQYYNPETIRVNHVPFGVVLREDGKKFKTREGKTQRLIDLLDDAVTKAKELLEQRDNEGTFTSNLQEMAEVLGINAIKYADLSNNRVSDYTFSFDRMLQFEGNTAAYLLYAYVRIQSIKRKIGADIDALMLSDKISLVKPEEIELGLHILQFNDVIQSFLVDLMPNRITDYLYHLAEKFHSFIHHCKVKDEPEQASRLLLCEASAKVLAKGFDLLGLRPLDQM